MSELYEKSLKKLELDRVLALLADLTGSQEEAQKCRELVPMTDADDVRFAQRQTAAACRLIETKGAPGFRGTQDVCASLLRAERGGSLSPTELLRIASVLRCARNVKSYGDNDYVATVLDPLFAQLTPNRFLEERITNSILSEDEIADAASSELADIRRKMRAQSAKIKEALSKIISSPAYAKALREPIITMRGDRYVVPVKAESKGAVPGLVHDVSSTGSTFFIEPMSAVNANNALRELALAEQAEIERILAELSANAAEHRDQIECDYQVLVELDVIFAKAQLSYKMHAIEPEIRTDGQLELCRARHPLIDPKTVVPITVRLGSDFDTLVITGPNTGGKTVTLKTLGLLTLMAECGLQIPADHGSCVNVFKSVLADIGDEQSIEQSLSTFSAHMKNIVEIVGQCDGDSLILFDELGAGTDPIEGAALAIAIIEHARKMGATVAATTHYAELKVYATSEAGIQNASCEFDVATLRPTYRLMLGIPGKSNAFEISRRLGLPENLIDGAKKESFGDDTVEDFQRFLREITGTTEDEKILIRCWFITHAHNDHTGGLIAIAEHYNDRVKIERVVYNFIAGAVADKIEANDAVRLNNALKTYYPKTPVYKCHTGQVYQIADATLTFFYTPEDYIRGGRDFTQTKNFNDTSIIFSVDIAGQRIMFLGDAQNIANNETSAAYGKELESDIVQIAHHAGVGGTAAIYNATRPIVALVTTDDSRLGQYLANSYTQTWVNGDRLLEYWNYHTRTTMFELPYKPTEKVGFRK